MIDGKGQVRVQVNTTGEEQAIDAAELEWESVAGDEREMGAETQWQTTWELIDREGREHSIEWNAWEYPVGVLNHHETKPSSELTVLVDLAMNIADDA